MAAGDPRRDKQKSKVYGWEQGALGVLAPRMKERIDLDQCKAIADMVQRAYGLTRVGVRHGSMRSYLGKAWYSSIEMRAGVETRATILHELAHVILSQKYNPPIGEDQGYASHGPEFMRVFFDLLTRYADIPARALRKSLTEARIKVAPAKKVPQPKRTVKARGLAVIKVKPKPTRCGKHNWLRRDEIGRKLTSDGMVVTYRALCTKCRKQVPAFTLTAAAAKAKAPDKRRP